MKFCGSSYGELSLDVVWQDLEGDSRVQTKAPGMKKLTAVDAAVKCDVSVNSANF